MVDIARIMHLCTFDVPVTKGFCAIHSKSRFFFFFILFVTPLALFLSILGGIYVQRPGVLRGL